MAFQILLNLFIAMIWMFLVSSLTPQAFLVGYLIGLSIIFVMRRYFDGPFYLSRVWAVVKLIYIFMMELFLANVSVLRIVLQPKMEIKPCIFSLETDLKQDWEITLLANLITLTPGTLVVHVSDDQKQLFIHAIDVEDVEAEIHSIKNSFEKAIREVSGT